MFQVSNYKPLLNFLALQFPENGAGNEARNHYNFSLAAQLAKIDRYEFRLMSMAYMGNFDELLNSAQPVSTKLSIFITGAYEWFIAF